MQLLRLAAALSLLLSGAVSAETFVVRDADPDCRDRIGSCGNGCTLRDALEAAKNNGPGQDVINFNIDGAPSSGLIRVCSSGNTFGSFDPRAFNGNELDSSVRINGYSQPGSRKNTAVDGSFNGVIRIQLVPDGVDLRDTADETDESWFVVADNVSIRGVELRANDSSGVDVISMRVRGDNFELLGSRIVADRIFVESTQARGDVPRTMVVLGSNARIGSDALPEHRNVWDSDSEVVNLRIEGEGTRVRNNLFGRSDSLAAADPALRHIEVARSARSTVIGLPGSAGENVFSSAVQSAIVVEEQARQSTRIESNRFVGNTGIAIDLGDDGVSAADSGDGDGVQNAAFIREVTAFLANPVTPATVRGQLLTPDTAPQQYSLEVYRNPAGCHPSGNGEGEFPIHRQTLTLGPGTAEFTLTLPTTATNPPNRSPRLQNGEAISVLVTSTGGDTSEFSRCAIVGAPAQEPPDANAATFVVTNTNDSGPGSFTNAVILASAFTGGIPRIVFRIPGAGIPTINNLESPIFGPVVIDGYTQGAVNPTVMPNTLEVGTNAVPGINLRAPLRFAPDAQGSVVRGIAFTGLWSGIRGSGTRFEGNFFGATAQGVVLQPSTQAVLIEDGAVLGGDQPDQRNWIAARAEQLGSSPGLISVGRSAVVLNNLIGVDRDGVTPIADPAPLTAGLLSTIHTTSGAVVENNTIGVQFSNAVSASGVTSGQSETGVTVQRNRFIGNAQPIDLRQSGVTTVAVTPSDPDDVDSNGANGLQNFPELQLAFMDQGQIRIDGRLDRPADSIPRKYALDFYASNSCNANGHGPGEILLGSRELVSDDATQEAFSFSLSAAGIDPTMVLTAIATEVATGNSSEMSACLAISGNPNPPPDPGAEDRIFTNGFE